MAKLIIIKDFLSSIPDLRTTRSLENPHSHRGDYEQLAFEPSKKPSWVSDILDLMEYSGNRTYEGWKGGDFYMDDHSYVYIAERGRSSYEPITPGGLSVFLGISSHPQVLEFLERYYNEIFNKSYADGLSF